MAVRERFYIPRLRQLCKSVKTACTRCNRFDAKPLSEIYAPLPKDRVTQSPPFNITGIDYCGPFKCKGSRIKHYICLFTCATTRAIHLELADSLTTDEFILCLRRFVSRRGTPNKIYSDNATTFVSASSNPFVTINSIIWNFIVPSAPWWGGFWERMVRTVKTTLKKTIGDNKITKKALITILTEIEFIINNRPLTYISEDVDIPTPLTPAHFLFGSNRLINKNYKTDEQNATGSLLRKRIAHEKLVLEHFWKRWSKEYLLSLPHSVNKMKSGTSVEIHSIVLVREDNLPRSQWRLGRIMALHPGRDGRVRTATLKTMKGELQRPIQRLHLMEL